jgi:aryl-alcohol dehydrogenase-like predicted oxidoreductase
MIADEQQKKAPADSPHLASCGARDHFVLGTAQLGMAYGRVNDVGKPDRTAAVQIVRYAHEHGVATFDTARAYGTSESVLGEALAVLTAKKRVITKLDLSGVSASASAAEVRRKVWESIDASCSALRVARVDAVLLHSWSHFHMWRGAAWERLLELCGDGKIEKLGASVYEPAEALDALQHSEIKHLQIPLNIIDWRWKDALKAISMERPDVEVHARGVLLQGILVNPAERWPVVNGFSNSECIRKLQGYVRKFCRESITDLCFAYVKSLTPISGVVIGCDTLEQLSHNLRLFQYPSLAEEQKEELERHSPKPPVELLNPTKWSYPKNIRSVLC